MVGIDHSRYDNNFTSTLRTSTFLFSFIHHFILLRHAVILYYTWYNITTINIDQHNIQYYINIFIVIGFSIFHSTVLYVLYVLCVAELSGCRTPSFVLNVRRLFGVDKP